MRVISAMALVLVISGCGAEWGDPTATLSPVRVMPMGPGQYMITCVDSPAYCVRQANKACPSAYDVTSNSTNSRDYGRMTMIIKCQ